MNSQFTQSSSKDIKSNDKASVDTPPKEKSRKARGDCTISASTSHTQYFKRHLYNRDEFKRITTNEFCGLSAESVSGSSDTFQCVHGPKGKQYTERGLLKRNLVKNLDPIKMGSNIAEDCPPALGWAMAGKLEFLIRDPVGVQQIDRLQHHLRDFANTSSGGFQIDTLNSVCVILDYLVDTVDNKLPYYREHLKELLKNTEKPILLIANSNVVTHFQCIRNFIGYLGSLLVLLVDDDLFEIVSRGVLWQLSREDAARGPRGAPRRLLMLAARTVLADTVARVIATATPLRFPTFTQIALLLACESEQNCSELLMENILENIFYRFNPYFPDRDLPQYDMNPYDMHDVAVRLGESSKNLDTILSLLLVLVKAAKQFADQNPDQRNVLPCPDDYSQRCFVWAYRYECRVEDRSRRITLTVIAHMLIHIFKEKFGVFCTLLMPEVSGVWCAAAREFVRELGRRLRQSGANPRAESYLVQHISLAIQRGNAASVMGTFQPDVLSLSVLTEIPPRNDWTRTVSFNISQTDVCFKKFLIHLSIDFLKLYPMNRPMVQYRHWIVGLMYLVDPGLAPLRKKWPGVLYCELRKTALQALTLAMPLVSPDTPTEISLIRRLMWYIEWYSESPYDLPVLYWSVRLLQSSMEKRPSLQRRSAIKELINTHGVIIIINLCNTLMNQKLPPVNKKQAIIGLNLRMLTSCLEYNARVSCQVYPSITWPTYTNHFVRHMMSIVLYCLDKCANFSDRWMISLLNLIWEAIIWRKLNREMFITNNGIYQILDIIVMSRYPVQILALALVCEVTREGSAVAQLVTWRANTHAASVHPCLVKPGATIISLIAAIFKQACELHNVKLDENNILQNLDFPLMSQERQEYMNSRNFFETRNQRTPFCLAACQIAGSRMAKCYAIFEMLSEDLKNKVDLADDAYKLYKNIRLSRKEEILLVLVSNYMTLLLNHTWLETQIQSYGFVPIDTDIMGEFLQIGKGWGKSIQQQQLKVLERFKKMDENEESNLYSFLERVRLNTALDTLRQVKCVARTSDRASITHALIHDAVHAYHRRASTAARLKAPVVQTYAAPLDIFNIIGQNIKVINIIPKHRIKKREDLNMMSNSSLKHQRVPTANIPEKALCYDDVPREEPLAHEPAQDEQCVEPNEQLNASQQTAVSYGSQQSIGSEAQKVSHAVLGSRRDSQPASKRQSKD